MIDAQLERLAVALRPRRFWQAVAGIYAALVLANAAMLVFAGARPATGALLVYGIDLLSLLALAGYGWRRSLRSAGLQLMVILLAAANLLRAVVVIYAVWPNLVPWHGDAYAWEALAILSSVPILVLVAAGLNRYATDHGHAA